MPPTRRRRGACWTGYRPQVLILVAGANPVMRSTCAPDLGDVLRQLAHRCQDRVHVASRGAAATATARQPGDRGQQRRRDQRFTGQRRLRRVEGHPAVHRRIRPRGGAPSGLDITVTAVMPRMTPFGDVGRRGIRAYSARSGQSEEDYLEKLGRVVTPGTRGVCSRRPGPPGCDDHRARVRAHG